MQASLTGDLAHTGTLVLPTVGPESQVASVGALQVGHSPIRHAEHQQDCQGDEDKRPAPQDELAVLLPEKQLV